MADGLAADAEAGGAVGQQALALGGADRLAEIGLLRQAVFALAAFGRVERDDVVALLQAGHAGADVDDDAGTLVAEDRGEEAFRVVAGEGEPVGVTEPSGLDLDQDLAGLRAFQLDGLDREGLAGGKGDGGADVHGQASPGGVRL